MSKHGTVTIIRRFNADIPDEYPDIRCPHCSQPHSTINKMRIDCMERSDEQFKYLTSLLYKEIGWLGMVSFINWEKENPLSKEEASDLIGSMTGTMGLEFEKVMKELNYEYE